MFKTPISIKGPKGQLQQLFTEKVIYQATLWLLNKQIFAWHYRDETQISRALITDDEAQEYTVSMSWPPQQPLGTCSCQLTKPCVHLAALAVYNKSKLDLIPPFTQQIKALQDINNTFMAWLGRQQHDPFPNMARHRLIYILDQNDEGDFICSLFKAYLSPENRYQIKGQVDSSLMMKKQLPKFVSLTDQFIMHEMNQNGLAKVHQVKIHAERDDGMLLMMLKSGRCFWKACYRPPLALFENNHQVGQTKITTHLVFSVTENAVSLISDSNHDTEQLAFDQPVTCSLHINTALVELEWSQELLVQLDVAHPIFSVGAQVFTLNDLVKGVYAISNEQLEAVSTASYQLEKLPSVYASFEPPVSQCFELNDRYLGDDFTAVAPKLVALSEVGWQIQIEAEYRHNRVAADQWYVDIKPASNDQGWFDLQLGVELGEQKINLIPYLIKAIKTGAFADVKHELMLQLDEGLNLGIEKGKIVQIMSTIAELYDGKAQEKLKLSPHQMLQVIQSKEVWTNNLHDSDASLTWLGAEEVKEKAAALQGINQLKPQTAPKHLKAQLRPYQQMGYSWLSFLAQHDFHGLLADDMGLGKTLQTLAFIQSQQELGALNAPCLIVAPTSLLGNWVAEARRFTPRLKVGVMSGPNRAVIYQKFSGFDVIVSSYGIISRDFQDLQQQAIHLLVLDEAQAIKNRKTQVAQVIKQLRVRHRLCLSGTPIENHLGELWSIFDFLMPGFLGNEKTFQQLYQWPIEKENDAEKLQLLQSRLAPFIMRRTKGEVAKELPDKNEIIKYIELEETQAHVYESIRITMTEEIRLAVKSQQNNQILIGNALLRLRQVCCHPALIKLEAVDSTAPSAKLNWLITSLPNLIEEGRKVLIFSSFTGMLKLIADALDELNLSYFKLTGRTSAANRTRYIAGFQAQQKPVFLISLKAGGAGINLTAADTVIHFDPWWNPAAEQQAADRAHRIGQDKQVFVYKLITRGTVEEKIHQLQQHKKQLADGLLTADNSINEILSSHQWETMLAPID